MMTTCSYEESEEAVGVLDGESDVPVEEHRDRVHTNPSDRR